MKRWLNLLVLVVMLVPSGLMAGCSSGGASHEVKMADASMLPSQVQSQPVRVREAYQFAVANPDALKNVPCYCGCGAMGHTSNYSCYVKEQKADGTLVFDDHALGCSICVDIAQDVLRMTREGRAPPAIRSEVVNTYSQFGPPNQ